MELNITLPHGLSEEEALKRLKGFSAHMKKYSRDKITDGEEKWAGNIGNFRFLVKGHSIDGTIVVSSSQVELSIHLPFTASFFKNKIEREIRERTNELLASDTISKNFPHPKTLKISTESYGIFVAKAAFFFGSVGLFLWLCSNLPQKQKENQSSGVTKEDAREAMKTLGRL
ncbi:MAG: polyhydroxyalkanoic acid system family protein [bacterium]|nr:polyhydroxyalkanoic acid system family protein [bacterium]